MATWYWSDQQAIDAWKRSCESRNGAGTRGTGATRRRSTKQEQSKRDRASERKRKQRDTASEERQWLHHNMNLCVWRLARHFAYFLKLFRWPLYHLHRYTSSPASGTYKLHVVTTDIYLHISEYSSARCILCSCVFLVLLYTAVPSQRVNKLKDNEGCNHLCGPVLGVNCSTESGASTVLQSKRGKLLKFFKLYSKVLSFYLHIETI